MIRQRVALLLAFKDVRLVLVQVNDRDARFRNAFIIMLSVFAGFTASEIARCTCALVSSANGGANLQMRIADVIAKNGEGTARA